MSNSTVKTVTAPIVGDSFLSRLRSNLKVPMLLTIFSLVGLLFITNGNSGQKATLVIAQGGEFFTLPALKLPSLATSVVLIVVCFMIAALAVGLTGQGKKVPVWLVSVFAFGWVVAFLVWVAAGKTLPLIGMLQGTLALSVPLVFGALAGILSERSGVINIAIEGQLLLGAFGAIVLASATGNVYVGILGAPIGGLIVATLLALFTIKYSVNQIIVGVVLNVLVSGLTGFLFGSLLSANGGALNRAFQLPNVAIPGLAEIPLLGPVLFNQNILVYAMYLIVAWISIGLFKTKWGLRVRAVGEHPHAADTMGINVNLTRWKNVMLGGLVAGLGGAVLTLSTGVSFSKDMSAGQGYIALAAMILGRWHPRGAVIAAVMFGFTNSLQIQLGILNSVQVPGIPNVNIPTQFLLMLPYVVTLFAVAGLVGRVRGPAAAGKPYEKGH